MLLNKDSGLWEDGLILIPPFTITNLAFGEFLSILACTYVQYDVALPSLIRVIGEVIRPPTVVSVIFQADCLRSWNLNPLFLAKLLRYTAFLLYTHRVVYPLKTEFII